MMNRFLFEGGKSSNNIWYFSIVINLILQNNYDVLFNRGLSVSKQ